MTLSEIRPYLCTKDARAAIDWYVESMGAEVTEGPIVMDDGRIGHVELSFGGAPVMMSDGYPDLHVEAPAEGRGAAVTLYLTLTTSMRSPRARSPGEPRWTADQRTATMGERPCSATRSVTAGCWAAPAPRPPGAADARDQTRLPLHSVTGRPPRSPSTTVSVCSA